MRPRSGRRGTPVHSGNGPAPVDTYWSTLALVGHKLSATDRHIRQLVRQASQAERPGSPPRRDCRTRGLAANQRLPVILPFPSFPSHARLHPALPQAPATRHGGAGRKGTMAKEICISSTPHETRLAILEDDQLAEIYYERENEYTLAGSIYNGRVTRVLPGMQSAFVDLGLERDAFLYVTDFLETRRPGRDATSWKSAPQPAPTSLPRGSPRESRREREPRRRPPRRTARAARPRRPPGTPGRPRQSPPEVGSRNRAGREHRPENRPASTAGGSEGGVQRANPALAWTPPSPRRRGSRPARVSDPVETEASAETYLEPADEAEPRRRPAEDSQYRGRRVARGTLRARGRPNRAQPARTRRPRAPAALRPARRIAFEVRRRAGAAEPPAPRLRLRRRAAGTPSKPSTLIEAPLAWDGSGLLPGESLCPPSPRHQPAQAEPDGVIANAEEPPDETDRVRLPESGTRLLSRRAKRRRSDRAEMDDEMVRGGPAQLVGRPAAPSPIRKIHSSPNPRGEESRERITAGRAHRPSARRPADENHIGHAAHSRTFDGGRSPTGSPRRRADPDRPEQTAARRSPIASESPRVTVRVAPRRSAAAERVPPVRHSAARRRRREDGASRAGEDAGALERGCGGQVGFVVFARRGPGGRRGHRGRGVRTPRHHHHTPDEHDLDDYEEEEKLPTQIRSGELGEMLQEAHLDHRIQLNFDDKNGDEDDATKKTKKRKRRASSRRHGAGSGTANAATAADAAVAAADAAAIAARPGRPPRPIAPLRADHRSAHHQRPAQAGPGDPGADRQGAHRQEGRAHHQPHRAARPLPGLHAHRHPRRRQPQDRLRRGAPAPEADSRSTSAATPPAASSSAPRPRAHRKKNSAPTCAS